MFKPVTPKIDFPEMERRILAEWLKSDLVTKYLQKNKKSKKKFSFLDGPITANNPMGVHHAWGRTYKDLWQRFFNMRGFRQRFQNGFDNQGLWVEVEVEKKLNFKNKKDIERYGIDKFVEKCKEHTLEFAKVQTEQSKRLGYFMDWENSYYTMSEENNYMIWFYLKKCHEEGLLYKGRDSVPWCPRCGTAISQHEILTEEYQELTHDSIFFKLPITERKNEYFLVWTTTPWTVPSNVALAVNPELIYASFKNKTSSDVLIFLKDLAPKVLSEEGWEKIDEFPGTKLVGLHYEAPFDDLPTVQMAKKENPEKFHIVFPDKENVNATEGTGIVHIAPGAGAEDFQMGQRENLPIIASIDEAANYIAGFNDLSGQNAKEKPELIFEKIRKIEDGKYLYKIVPYAHRYPVCWRCKTELVWRVVDEWYIRMDPLRERLKTVAGKVKWIPSWGLEMELDWLKNMHDWLISKKRYWGLALPIWECGKCGEFTVIGSKEELKKKAVSGWEKFEGKTPHRPWIDEVKIKCPKCGGQASRIPDVGNPWLDAGIVPFSTLHYQTNKDYWREWFPADFITECFPGQFKNWFYSLLAMATVLENTNPFKTLLGHALVRDEKGEEMHKSKGNAIDFSDAAEKMGVDVLRWIYVTQNSEINLNFGYHVADEVRRRFHLMLWNIYNFFVTYANVDGWKLQQTTNNKQQRAILDQWILSKLHQLIQAVTQSLEDYDAASASRAIESFVVDLSTWYVRRSRDRVGPAVENSEDKNACHQTLYEVLITLTKLLAPFTPFLAEEIYKNLTGEESVHLADWPEFNEKLIDKKLEEEMKMARQVVELAHAKRKEAGIRVRQPLRQFSIFNGKATSSAYFQFSINDELIDLIKTELNVKEVRFVKGKGELKIELDTKITPQLAAEGEARELIRQIQELRKQADCALDEKIIVHAPAWPKDFEDYIKKQTLAKEIIPSAELKIERIK